ncbi:class C beta-lactamase [Massilia sp. CMS3.1]|uniref:class C beta-lactamase n=1 Tax=Massilia sp. CMS3.1 TaxID=3373083 RepID=UPI003EE77D7B
MTRRKRVRWAAAVLMCAWCFPGTGWAADDATALRAAVDGAIRPLMAEHDVPGMAVAVTVDGRVSFFNYGLASREQNSAVSEHTLFELGSISKTFAATLAAYAHEQGALSLADHPGTWLPQLKGSALDRATLLHLGTYTAGGLPLQVPEEVSDLPQAMAYFQSWKPEAAPGTVRRYSNPSLGLFGYIAALAMKSDFAGAVEGLLFPQFGLRQTYVKVPAGAQENYAWGYNRANKAIRVNPGVFDAEAYGVKSSTADMIRYVQANIDPSRLAAPLQRAVEATHVGHFDVGPVVQGLGWEQYPYPVTLGRLLAGNSDTIIMNANPVRPQASGAKRGPILFNKTGSTGGFGGYVLFVPDKKIGVVMLANRNYPIPARVKAGYAILEQLARAAK